MRFSDQGRPRNRLFVGSPHKKTRSDANLLLASKEKFLILVLQKQKCVLDLLQHFLLPAFLFLFALARPPRPGAAPRASAIKPHFGSQPEMRPMLSGVAGL